MEFIDGISLHEHLEKIGNFSIKEAVYYFRHILEAIKELHSFNEKIIHRDLKPENIMLTKDLMNIKIIDFGISSVVVELELTNDKKAITSEESLFGTFPYISPDLLKMRGKSATERQQIISEQFDFFSLGVIFYEMLMGEKPFKIADEHDQNVIKLPLTYDMMCISDINPTIPVAIENIIFRCLASKDSDLKFRYHSVNEIMDDLNNYSTTPEKSTFNKLLKPKNERTLQLTNTFNVQAQKLKEKFYEKPWFYWLLFSIAIVIVVVIIVLVSDHIINFP
jgi:serine/threonine-protein kinase